MIHDFKAVTLSQMCHGITDKTKIGIFQIRFKLCVIPEIRSNNHSITINKFKHQMQILKKGILNKTIPSLLLTSITFHLHFITYAVWIISTLLLWFQILITNMNNYCVSYCSKPISILLKLCKSYTFNNT